MVPRRWVWRENENSQNREVEPKADLGKERKKRGEKLQEITN